MNLSRTCPNCKKTKELTEKNYNRVDGIPNAFDYYCKICMSKIEKFIENNGNA